MQRVIVLLSIMLSLLTACNDTRTADYQVPELNFKNNPVNGFSVPEGWQVSVWAQSPDLYNPTNIDVDEKGRIWVTEAVNYRNFNNDPEHTLHFEKGDSVMILEDTDGDGVSDTSKVFVEDEDLVAPPLELRSLATRCSFRVPRTYSSIPMKTGTIFPIRRKPFSLVSAAIITITASIDDRRSRWLLLF